MSKIILHCGAHKTGTSAFQIWLKDNKSKLHSCGFVLPENGASKIGNYVQLAHALTGDNSTNLDKRKFLLESLRNDSQSNPDRDIIISAEFLSMGTFVRADDKNSTYANASRNLEPIDRVKTAILVVRDQREFLNSLYGQVRKSLNEVPDFNKFIHQQVSRQRANWLHQSQEIMHQGFEFHALAYTRELRKRGIVKSMLSLPLFDRARYISSSHKPQYANQSLSAHGLILADLVRSRALERVAVLSAPIQRHLSQLVIKLAKDSLPGNPFNGLTEDLAHYVESAYAASNREFANRHLNQAWKHCFPAIGSISEISPQTISDLSHSEAKIIDELALKVIRHAENMGYFEKQ